MTNQTPAAVLIRVPFANGTGAEVALLLDELGDVVIGRPLDCDAPRVFDVRHNTEFFFPGLNHTRRILGPERALYLLGGTPGLLGREGLAEAQRQLLRLQRLDAEANGEPPLPSAIARRLGLSEQTPLPELPDFGDDRPPGQEKRPQ